MRRISGPGLSIAILCFAPGLAAALWAGVPAAATPRPVHPAGLGKVLTTKDGGQIYGFDINQNGDDGVLASAGYDDAGNFFVSMQTFDQNTGKIIRKFATKNPSRNSYSVAGIYAGDVGLVTHYIIPDGQIYAKRVYDVMNPVTANKFTGAWTPPLKDVDIQLVAENQATSTALMYVIQLKKQDNPALIVSNVGANTFSNVIKLDPNTFCGCDGPKLGHYAAANEAVIALSPDGGAVGGEAPVNYIVDLTTGKTTSFQGYNNGAFHAGYVTGAATDINTGVTATDTELNAQVEFYDIAKQQGIAAVQLPCTGSSDQTYSGSGIANDPVNRLFLVTETYDACSGGATSSIHVFDEKGNYIESITGFKFAIGEPAPAINPSKRMGWAFGGPGFTQLQQFFY
jgi:hypothetical protein